jgi:hypothetical protein
MSNPRFVNPPRYVFDEATGTIRVNVLSAEEDDRRKVADIQPRIRLDATLTVRGVPYTVYATYRWERTAHAVYARGHETGEQTHWQEITSQYNRVDSGKRPHYDTPTYRVLYDTVWRVLERLATDHPEWRRESLMARLREMASTAEQTAASARHQWMEANSTAVELRAELATALSEFSQRVSGVCLYCGQPVRLSATDPLILWVHTQTGNMYCDVDVPEDAVLFAGTPGRTEATPRAESIRGEPAQSIPSTPRKEI